MAQPSSYCPILLQWPCLPTSEWAAWAQVLVAVAIGFAAVYVPWRMAQMHTRRRVSSALTLCGITAFQFIQAADAALARHPDPMHYKYFRDAGNDMLQALRQIPTHELIEWEVMHARIYLELRCVEFVNHANTWLNDDSGFTDLPPLAHEEMERLRELLQCSIGEISNLMRRPYSLKNWIIGKLRRGPRGPASLR